MDKHTAHVFRDDLEKLQNSECAVTVYSVEMRDPDRGETIPLVVADQPPPAPVAEELGPKNLGLIISSARLAVEYADSGVFEQGFPGRNYAARSGYYQGVLTGLINELETFLASQPAMPDVDALAEFIRDMDDGEYIPYHEFAQRICNWIEEQKNDQ